MYAEDNNVTTERLQENYIPEDLLKAIGDSDQTRVLAAMYFNEQKVYMSGFEQPETTCSVHRTFRVKSQICVLCNFFAIEIH